MNNSLLPLLWFAAIIALIPLALWLLKRSPLGGASSGAGSMRSVSSLPLSNTHRLLTVEVGQGDQRRWLVLGVTPHNINLLHTMEPPTEAAAAGSPGARRHDLRTCRGTNIRSNKSIQRR
jgi:flagellar protein FliO/FliZ